MDDQIESKMGKSSLSLEDEYLKKPLVGYRWILAFLCLYCNFLIFFVRNTFSVSLVKMVNSTMSEEDVTESSDVCPAALSNSTEDVEDHEESTGEFNWTTSEQGIILGAFFWGYVFSKLFASRIGEYAGQRATIFTSVLLATILELFSPMSAYVHPYFLAAVRFLIGVSYGPIPAAQQSLLSIWAPRRELASMLTTCFSGATLGGMTGFFLAGWLVDAYGWRMSFWLGGILSFLFLPPWFILIRNSPMEHPWLSPYEGKLLEENKHITTKNPVPWIKILSSPYVLVCIFSHFVRSWLDGLMSTEGPSYFINKIGFELNTASFICGLNYLTSMLLMLLCGRISDAVINKHYVKTLTSRKIFHLIGMVGPAVLLVGLCLAGCHGDATAVLWMGVGGLAVATTCSYNISIIDFAPNFAGTVMGLLAIGNTGGALAPMVTSTLLSLNNGWNLTFYLTAALNLLGAVVYTLCMTDQIQPWNYFEKSKR